MFVGVHVSFSPTYRNSQEFPPSLPTHSLHYSERGTSYLKISSFAKTHTEGILSFPRVFVFSGVLSLLLF